MKILFFLIMTIPFFSACSKNDSAATGLPQQVIKDLSYGTDAKQKMDLYLPANRTTASTPVFILIHGGGWSGGDKSDLQFFVDSLKKYRPDMAIVSLNYRLASLPSTNIFPTQEEDVKAALNFLFAKLEEYKLSSNWVIGGDSAGGHLAMLTAYKGSAPVALKALVNYYGPSDMALLYNSPELSPFKLSIGLLLSGTPESNPTGYFNNSPINFVSAASPPTIIFQGDADPVVAINQQTKLKEKMVSLGVKNELYIYPGQGHGFTPPVIADTIQKLLTFLSKYL